MEQIQVIQNKIYEIRGQKVMLDFDLAELYLTENRLLKRAVRRNINRFPEDFMFELTKEEANVLLSNRVSQNGIPLYNFSAYTPFAFTEQGVAMLSSVLRSEIAIKVNINIMRAFVALRRLVANPPADKLSQLQQELTDFKTYVEEVFADYNDINEDTWTQLELINQTLAELQEPKRLEKPRNPVGFVKPGETRE